MNISIIGGTGKLGFGLAKRFANKGMYVMIGSRSGEKAINAAKEINTELGTNFVQGNEIEIAAEWGDIIFITVPFAAQSDTVEKIKEYVKGKIVVDTTVPLTPGSPTLQLDRMNSTAEDVSNILGDTVKLVSGFHTISHTILTKIENQIDGDVLICGNDEDALHEISSLIEKIHGHPVIAGGLLNARVLERLTPMIIGMNKRYKKRHIGIQVTGL